MRQRDARRARAARPLRLRSTLSKGPRQSWRTRDFLKDERSKRIALAALSSGSVDTGDCIEWTRAVDGKGYGVVWVGMFEGVKVYASAHRLAYFLEKGAISDTECIRHTCHNPRCLNSKHLVSGTHKENMDDMTQAGRGWWQKAETASTGVG